MATASITATLNGGDLVTPKNDLIYKIYGSADGYTTPIKTTGSHTSDADVTVTGDSVTINNVNIGAETLFKITALDAASNESVKSDAYDTVLVFETEYDAMLSYAGSNGFDLPDSTQQQKDNNKVKYLKSVGAWAKMDKVHIFNATYAPSSFTKNFYRLNWKDPGTYTLTAVSGKEPTWVSGSGFKAVGASGNFLKTGFIPSTNGVNMKANDASEIIGTFGIPTTFTNVTFWYGGRVANDTGQILILNLSDSKVVFRLFSEDSRFDLTSQINVNGHLHGYRSSSVYKVFNNGVEINKSSGSSTSPTGTLPTVEQYMFGFNNNGSFTGNDSDVGIKYQISAASLSLLTTEMYQILTETYTP